MVTMIPKPTSQRCVTNTHAWQALCACGKAKVCRRCGAGE
jgi:hypothetical protein